MTKLIVGVCNFTNAPNNRSQTVNNVLQFPVLTIDTFNPLFG